MLLQASETWRSRRTQREARPDALPPRPVAADGRGGSGEGTSRARGRGEEGTTQVAVAGGLATLTHGGERDPGAAVATEEKRNGGEVGTKRGLEERAARSPPPLPPPKRRAVSAVRQFPPGCGRDAAVPLGRRHGRGRNADGGVRPLDQATAPPLAGSKTDLPLEAVVDGGDPIANVHQIFIKSSHASDENQVARKLGSLKNGVQEGAANSGELLGRKQVMAQAANVLPKRRMVSATRCFPPGCGRDVKTGSGLEFMAVDASCGGVSKEVVATDGGDSLGSLKVLRADLQADKIVRKLPGFIKPGPIVGNVRVVEVGDEFLYRVELALVGLHRPYQGGIDIADHNGVLVAISIVASGGYPDRLSSAGELIYTGSGGQPTGKKKSEDQKLERGNLALKNCIKTKTPVRVIHGFKGQNAKDDSYSRAKQISAFTYDGLYHVVDYWREGLKGSMVFKYRLQRIHAYR
uniref:YDG domain-containing protein n=1 Tax=Oryza glumipatula TaxID=40148 RepID=A0A0E0AV20_9ORYZ